MKKDIHPKWYPNCQVACACGNTFTTGATVAELRVQLCNKCHPFFTGEQKFIDTLGKVERFERKRAKAAQIKTKKQKKKIEKEQEERAPKTLREMLMGE